MVKILMDRLSLFVSFALFVSPSVFSSFSAFCFCLANGSVSISVFLRSALAPFPVFLIDLFPVWLCTAIVDPVSRNKFDKWGVMRALCGGAIF